jgi:hypothetical protein
MVVVLVLGIASLCAWRTSQPTLHGDGPTGNRGLEGHSNLRPHLPVLLARIVHVDFHAATCALTERSYELDQATVLVGLMAGALVMLIAFAVFWRHRADAVVGLGAYLFVVTLPALAGSYGHYDSYGEGVLAQLLWWGLFFLWLRRATAWPGVLLLTSMALAISLHPIHLVLVAYVFYYVLYTWVLLPRVTNPRQRAVLAVLFAVGLAAASFLRVDNNSLTSPMTKPDLSFYIAGYIFRFLHMRVMAFLLTALPATILFLYTVAESRDSLFGSARAGVSTCATVFLNSFLLMLTLGMDCGIADEFLYGLMGTIALASSLLLFLQVVQGERRRVLVYFAVLSLFLQIPRLAVNSGDRNWDRFRGLFPEDQCLRNIRLSPYLNLGLITPIDRPEDRQRKLVAFADGTDTKVEIWEQYRINNLMFLTAWYYEFGERMEGRRRLRQVLENEPRALRELWMDSVAYTHRYSNTAYRLIREDSEVLLRKTIEEDTIPETYSVHMLLWEYLMALKMGAVPASRFGEGDGP